MNIYLIRHGQTNSNASNHYYGSLDIPLNQVGVRQMKKVRRLLASIDFDRIYSSDLLRAIQSLEICMPQSKDKIQIDKRLRELNFGDFEGLSYDEICKLYPLATKEWKEDWKYFRPPNGETFYEFYNRVSISFEDIVSYGGRNILIVAHSGVIRAIYAYILKGNMDLYWSFTCDHGKVNIIKHEYGNLFISAINKGDDVEDE